TCVVLVIVLRVSPAQYNRWRLSGVAAAIIRVLSEPSLLPLRWLAPSLSPPPPPSLHLCPGALARPHPLLLPVLFCGALPSTPPPLLLLLLLLLSYLIEVLPSLSTSSPPPPPP